ncbi:hypothetical protein D3C78_939500 [compost metagenome]
MNLIELYIQEVTRRLPEKNREDIALELRSTIEDMLPDEYTEQEVKDALSKLGNPAVLASGYRDQPMHLIGPRYYDIYITLLKMILPIAAAITIISLIANKLIGYSGDEAVHNLITNITASGAAEIINTMIQVFFWLTLTFAILERAGVSTDKVQFTTSFKAWTPDDLKRIAIINKKRAISKLEVFGSLLGNAIFAAVYFNAGHLIGVYEAAPKGLEYVIPVFNQASLDSYWPIVVIIVGLEVCFCLYKLMIGQWTRIIALLNTAVHFITAITFIVMISDSSLLNPDFISYMKKLFEGAGDLFGIVYWSAIWLWLIFAALDSYTGFRKARVKG